MLKEINPEYSLEGLMLKLQNLGHLMRRADSLAKTLMLGKTKGRRRRGRGDEVVGGHHWPNEHKFEQTQVDSEGQGCLACCSPWDQSQTQLSDWTTTLKNIQDNKKIKWLSKLCSEPERARKEKKVKLLSRVQLFVTPWTVACEAPLSMEFSRQEYWSGLPFSSPGDLPDPGIEPGLLYCGQTLYHLSHQGSPRAARKEQGRTLWVRRETVGRATTRNSGSLWRAELPSSAKRKCWW